MKLQSIILLSLASLAVSSFAADKDAKKESKPAVRATASFNPCKDPQTTSEMVACANHRYEAADLALNRMWNRVKENFTTGDVDESTKEQWRRLVAAEKAWLPFRDAQCLADVENIGGTLERVEVPGCMARLTFERTQYLQKFLPQNDR